MYYTVETDKSFEQASDDLGEAVARHGFGVLHIHDLGNTLRSKGFDFTKQCRVFEVCNPGQANKVMGLDMDLNMALPCRISVFTEGDATKIGFIKPIPMLEWLSQDERLRVIAEEVEEAMTAMVDESV